MIDDGGSAADGEFLHCVLIVDSDQTLRDRLVPALNRSLVAGQPVQMVVSEHTEQVVRAALGADADKLDWADRREAFSQRLGFIFETFRRYLAEEARCGRHVHVVAEPDILTDPDGPVDRVAAYMPYESACNDAYAEFGCTVTCLWDSRRQPTFVIENVRALHNYELGPEGTVPNPEFIAPVDYLRGRNLIRPEPPPPSVDRDLVLRELWELAALRGELRDWAAGLGFVHPASDDVVVAANEAATNGLIHGVPPVRVRCWHHRDTLVVQVDDTGGMSLPSTAGYERPVLGFTGRGLWIARQLADVVTTSATEDNTTVRLHFPYRVTHRDLV